MTWQLLGSGDGPWEIQNTEIPHRWLAIIYCDEETARLLCAAREMREALEAVEWVLAPAGWDTAEHECPWCDSYKRHGHLDCHRQRALRLAAGDTKEEGNV